MRKIIIIPVREDSKRLPGKALLEVNKLPLWYHTYLQCAKSNANEIYIVTDSIKVKKQCLKYYIPYSFIKNCWCGTVRVAEAYQHLTKQQPDDLILNVQCDYPLIQPKSINLLFNQPSVWYKNIDFVTLYYNIDNYVEFLNDFIDTNVVKIIGTEISNPGEILCHYFTRHPYKDSFGHIGLYLFQPSAVKNILCHKQSYLSVQENLEQLTWIGRGAKIKALFTERELSINTKEDFEEFKQLCNIKN